MSISRILFSNTSCCILEYKLLYSRIQTVTIELVSRESWNAKLTPFSERLACLNAGLLCTFESFLFAFSVPDSSTPFNLTYTDLGCWADNITQRSVPSQEGDPLLVGSAYNTRENAIQKCGKVAAKHDFEVFVLQVNIFGLFNCKLPYLFWWWLLTTNFENFWGSQTYFLSWKDKANTIFLNVPFLTRYLWVISAEWKHICGSNKWNKYFFWNYIFSMQNLFMLKLLKSA